MSSLLPDLHPSVMHPSCPASLLLCITSSPSAYTRTSCPVFPPPVCRPPALYLPRSPSLSPSSPAPSCHASPLSCHLPILPSSYPISSFPVSSFHTSILSGLNSALTFLDLTPACLASLLSCLPSFPATLLTCLTLKRKMFKNI